MASAEQNIKAVRFYKRTVEQVIGRECETATLFSRCLLTSTLLLTVLSQVNLAVKSKTITLPQIHYISCPTKYICESNATSFFRAFIFS
jgi:hypothetical protein